MKGCMVVPEEFNNRQQNQTGAIMTRNYNFLASASQMINGIGAHTPAVFMTEVSQVDRAVAEYRSTHRGPLWLPPMWMVAMAVMVVSLVAGVVG